MTEPHIFLPCCCWLAQEQQALVLSTVRAELLRAQVEAQQVKEQLQATRLQHEEQLAGLRRDIRNLHVSILSTATN
jgi:hypothetical protein